MVAYNFTTGIDAVAAGTKRMTIRRRDTGKRHARPGDRLQLYTGMRTKRCRKLVTPDPICICVDEIDIEPRATRVRWQGRWLSNEVIMDFAVADGFDSVIAFFAFFGKGGVRHFPGVVIQW